jgi:signal transduction histidine kinase
LPEVAVRLPELDLSAHDDDPGLDGIATFPLLLDRRPAAGLLQIEACSRLREAEVLFLRSVADQLAAALDRRAARLRDVQLRERAEALDHRQKELMAIVSHDVRNPLAAVLLGVSTLLRRPDMSEGLRREHLDVMHRAATRAARLVHDLLDASRIEEGKLVLTREPLPLSPLVDEALEILRPLSAEREVACSASLGDGLPAVLADRERLLQVFGNLIGNAIQFTRPGGAVAVRAEPDGELVRCAVLDQGPGIGEADLPRVFDRYWQGARRDSALPQRGAGLGLAIAKGIVEAHGGRIWVESRVGEGSSFVFTLPAAR